jgi:glutamate-1-semialdehyde 2,1-aminomutase
VPLIFDEVKTGAAVAAGGATELFGVTPDIVCLAKAICGGLPGGAVGMTDALAELVESNAGPPAGHVQRQPARDGRRPGDAARGPHARRLRAPARHQRAA